MLKRKLMDALQIYWKAIILAEIESRGKTQLEALGVFIEHYGEIMPIDKEACIVKQKREKTSTKQVNYLYYAKDGKVTDWNESYED
jgi:hypothetical protein